MRLMLLSLFGAVVIPTAARANTECSDVMAALRIEPPAHHMQFDDVIEGGLLCPPKQMRMFKANYNAIENAQPVTDPAMLFGTWMSDDVFNYVTGKAGAGQEILRISAGDKKGELRVEQLWFKVNMHLPTKPIWDENLNYTGVIAQGILNKMDDLGGYSDDEFQPSFRYGTAQFELSRARDLFVKQSLNYFDSPLVFSISGETLVMKYQKKDMLTAETLIHYATFSRVSPKAPELSMMLIDILEESQVRNFDCFTHQLSEKKGPLIEALAPFQLDEIEDFARKVLTLKLRLSLTLSALRAGEANKDELIAQMRELQTKIEGMQQSEEFKALNQLTPLGRGLKVCPHVY